jgi:hypothetical protein
MLSAGNMPLGAVGSWSADEVAGWLRDQGLSDAVIVEFKGTAGSHLVLLTAEDMVDAGVGRMQAKALVKMIQAPRVEYCSDDSCVEMAVAGGNGFCATHAQPPAPPSPIAQAPAPAPAPTLPQLQAVQLPRACYAGCITFLRKQRHTVRPYPPPPPFPPHTQPCRPPIW